MGFGCLFQEIATKDQTAHPGGKTSENEKAKPKNLKRPEGNNGNNAAPVKNEKEQRNQSTQRAKERWVQLAQEGTGLAPTQHWGWKGLHHPKGDSQAAFLLTRSAKSNAQEVGRGGASVPIPQLVEMRHHMVSGDLEQHGPYRSQERGSHAPEYSVTPSHHPSLELGRDHPTLCPLSSSTIEGEPRGPTWWAVYLKCGLSCTLLGCVLVHAQKQDCVCTCMPACVCVERE